MQTNFTAQFFIGNRIKLRKKIGTDTPIILTANGLLQLNADNAFSFRQDSSFWYLTGIDDPDCVLVIEASQEYLIVPTLSHIKEVFDGGLNYDHLSATSGITTIVDKKEGWTRLKETLTRTKAAAVLLPNQPYIKSIGMYTNPARQTLIRHLKTLRPKVVFTDIRSEVSALRVIKEDVEIAAIQRAVDITCQTFNTVMERSYAYEYELEADIEFQFRKSGANGHAYHSIVAGGKNACTLHYEKNADPFVQSDLVLVDAGAQEGYYAADMTRTWSFGKPSGRQKSVVEAVNNALEFGLEQLKPGRSFAECEQNVRSFVGKELQKLGLIKSQDKASIQTYYPHAPHYLGLDVHDSGDYHQPLEAGMVLTLEPGIYIPDERIGVRIEDDILITEQGYEVLSKACPRVGF